MPVEMAMWKMTAAGPQRLETSPLDFERRLEDMIVNDPSLIGLAVIVLGRQVPTGYGGFVDVLGVDLEGRVHVIELKRDRTPREVVAQVLDYGSWAKDLTLSDVSEIFADKIGGTLGEREHLSQTLDVFEAALHHGYPSPAARSTNLPAISTAISRTAPPSSTAAWRRRVFRSGSASFSAAAASPSASWLTRLSPVGH
jgi:hypothetical protein